MRKSEIVETLPFEQFNKYIRIYNENGNWENLNDEIIENDEEFDNTTDLEKYDILLNVIQQVFSQNDISNLSTELKVINYFYTHEKQCLEFITENFKEDLKEKKLFKRFLNTLLRLLFEKNKSILEISEKINEKLIEINNEYDNIDIYTDLSSDNYMNKIERVFSTKDLPQFLLVRGFRKLNELIEYQELLTENSESTNESLFINMNEYEKKENEGEIKFNINIFDIIKKFYSEESIPFIENYNISLNLNLLHLFLFLYQQYKGEEGIEKMSKKDFMKLSNYFGINEESLFDNIKENINNQNVEITINEIIISSSNNEIKYILKYIIASYCYIIFEMDFDEPLSLFTKLINLINNYIKDIFDADIYLIEFLGKICSKEEYNNYFKKKTFKIPNPKHLKTFDLNTIQSIFQNSDNPSLIKALKHNIEQEQYLEEMQRKNNKTKIIGKIFNWLKSIFTMVDEKKDSIERKLKLFPYKTEINGDIITMLVSGFYSSDSNQIKDWKKFTDKYLEKYPRSMFYYFNWPSSQFGFNEFVYHREEFHNATERAKNCGKILANIIESKLFFGNFKINLVAFSLGNQVIKYCLKELSSRKVYNVINDVIFIAGATCIKHKDKWSERLQVVNGNVINCYSKLDMALVVRFFIEFNSAIGRNPLIIPFRKIKNIDCSPCIHLLYRTNLGKICSKIINNIEKFD